jgi:glycosyltransferase involved in cell wall biosynthesis
MFLEAGAGKFFVRGVSYGPFRPNEFGEPFPEKQVVERDLALLRELGANALRVYHVPPGWLCELARTHGMRLLVGVPWPQHVRFLDSGRDSRAIRDAVREAAQGLREVPNLLALLIGNEIPPGVVRWHGATRIERFLSDLADEVRQVNPEALVSYANFPMTEYLELGFLDFACFNVYLHRDAELRNYLARLQVLAGNRPLVISEFGIDSIREGNQGQAEIVARTIQAASELGCAGTVVFSFTDEWHTGGFDIEDWRFGLVTSARRRKPAFRAVKRLYRSELPAPIEKPPRVSVVVCAYNAERTLEECLDSLRRLRYPEFEVIVVDDGSTDGTRAIAERYPEFRLISHENRGLSVARNEGILAARGSIVAFTDSDCAVDPDWLTYLVHRLQSDDFAAVGGPNLPPPDDHWVPEVVARSPGGPTHVLLTDHEAEHIPGCNMAFWRDRLLEVGSFDPIFRTAGDDVDACWRLQNAGYRIGFSAAALVWHRRRNTVRAYLRQQQGYGRAEALLYFKHPYRFNQLGHSRWLGRIYNDVGAGPLAGRPVIYSGPFGEGLFQTLYEPASSALRDLPSTLEWNLLATAATLFGVSSYLLGIPLPTLLIAGLALYGLAVAQAAYAALRADVRGLPRWRACGLLALLNYLGPLVRAVERHVHRTSRGSRVAPVRFPAARQQPEVDARRRRFVLSYWNETGIEKQACISGLIQFFRPRDYSVILDDGWQRWDLSIRRGLWVRGQLQVLVQNHGESKRQVDVGVSLRQTTLPKLLKGIYGLVAAIAVAGGAWVTALSIVVVAIATEAFMALQAYRLADVIYHAVEIAFRSLPLEPLGGSPGLPRSEP